MKRIIIIEEDDNGNEIRRRKVPYTPSWQDGYTCPVCGKHVGSMEVHPCTQPYCGGKFIYEEERPEHSPFCWNYGGWTW